MWILQNFESAPLFPVIWISISVTYLSNVKSACAYSRFSPLLKSNLVLNVFSSFNRNLTQMNSYKLF